ncbi:succinyl-diaminopimelate desuccinylase [Propylenella binzhouense]|uniref:succinyl-diaminopimelate desuccinylase n=1 Tax=Propylenella binzhouense TaxID=2555902 RepID=UPI0031B5D0B2
MSAPAADILVELLAAPSVTPDAGPALDVIARLLSAAGFSVDRPVFTEPGTPDVENLFAAIGAGERHFVFVGHADVVPPGDPARWRHPPFAAAVEDGVVYGRGAVDMKGGLAAFIAAALRFLERRGPEFGGRLSFLVTGDEEGPAVNGTAKLLAWAKGRGEGFSAALVGEPTSVERLGDQIKIGRRGSFSATLVVTGRQGHAAYPHLAENPIRGLTELLWALQAEPLDAGTDHFEPSTFEVVSVDVGNPAWNVIPGSASARFNSRFNDLWDRASLRAEVERRLRLAAEAPRFSAAPIRWSLAEEPSPSDVFLTHDEALIGLVSRAVEEATGLRPRLSTGGGTSDARFVKDYCPVVEFGPVGTSMHQADERIGLDELERLAAVYERILDAYFTA